MDEFDWIYNKTCPMENVYVYLYYNYVDSNMSHIMWRLMPTIDEWSEQETKTYIFELLKKIIPEYYKDFETFLKEHPEIDCEYTHEAIDIIRKKTKGEKEYEHEVLD